MLNNSKVCYCIYSLYKDYYVISLYSVTLLEQIILHLLKRINTNKSQNVYIRSMLIFNKLLRQLKSLIRINEKI